jgi:predicted nucleotidyltransferase/DNA-binding XRE family transcriptional regulator
VRTLSFINTQRWYPKDVELKEIRRAKGLSQKQAATLLGISVRTYQNYEGGKSSLTSFSGKNIIEKLTNYEPYTETKGILPLDLIKAKTSLLCQDYPIQFVYLFGSYAKGTPNEKSDVDLLMQGDVDGLAYFGLAEKLRVSLHKKIDLIRLQDLSHNQNLLSEILATGVRIYEQHEK